MGNSNISGFCLIRVFYIGAYIRSFIGRFFFYGSFNALKESKELEGLLSFIGCLFIWFFQYIEGV